MKSWGSIAIELSWKAFGFEILLGVCRLGQGTGGQNEGAPPTTVTLSSESDIGSLRYWIFTQKAPLPTFEPLRFPNEFPHQTYHVLTKKIKQKHADHFKLHMTSHCKSNMLAGCFAFSPSAHYQKIVATAFSCALQNQQICKSMCSFLLFPKHTNITLRIYTWKHVFWFLSHLKKDKKTSCQKVHISKTSTAGLHATSTGQCPGLSPEGQPKVLLASRVKSSSRRCCQTSFQSWKNTIDGWERF